jgi:Raf kinase inhibitor-like YbhB/YbcL family protein
MSFQLTSPAFLDGQPIPEKYTCEGENVSHALAWTGAPAGTQSFVLINDDPDDDGPKPWVHWLIYNIPGSAAGLPENIPVRERLPDGSLQGTNSFKKIGYGGPCPPTGVHHYTFTLFALDRLLPVAPKATRETIEAAMQGHVLGQARLVGTYIKHGPKPA